jgi:hypothetical protein
MLEAHEGRLVWLKDHSDVDIVEQMKTVSAFANGGAESRMQRASFLA